jgi:hypothetical protein
MHGNMTHHVPGRLRMRFPQLKYCEARAAQVAASIRQLEGVVTVDANTVTGGMLIFYDVNQAETNGFWHSLSITLAAQGLSGHADARAPQLCAAGASTFADKVADRLVGALVDKLVERSALALVSVLL